jgi:O-methyltransferase
MALTAAVKSRGLEVVRRIPLDVEKRRQGLDWPEHAETMIGMQRMDNLQFCVTDVLRRGVPGDLIETGVWRGGAVILMRGVLKAYGDAQRRVWVADSFQGLPRPNPQRFPADAGDRHWTFPALAASLDEVRDNFARYGLLDHQVQFLPGWFSDTLPTAPSNSWPSCVSTAICTSPRWWR